jgi:hypothetical protein
MSHACCERYVIKRAVRDQAPAANTRVSAAR